MQDPCGRMNLSPLWSGDSRSVLAVGISHSERAARRAVSSRICNRLTFRVATVTVRHTAAVTLSSTACNGTYLHWFLHPSASSNRMHRARLTATTAWRVPVNSAVDSAIMHRRR